MALPAPQAFCLFYLPPAYRLRVSWASWGRGSVLPRSCAAVQLCSCAAVRSTGSWFPRLHFRLALGAACHCRERLCPTCVPLLPVPLPMPSLAAYSGPLPPPAPPRPPACPPPHNPLSQFPPRLPFSPPSPPLSMFSPTHTCHSHHLCSKSPGLHHVHLAFLDPAPMELSQQALLLPSTSHRLVPYKPSGS